MREPRGEAEGALLPVASGEAVALAVTMGELPLESEPASLRDGKSDAEAEEVARGDAACEAAALALRLAARGVGGGG